MVEWKVRLLPKNKKIKSVPEISLQHSVMPKRQRAEKYSEVKVLITDYFMACFQCQRDKLRILTNKCTM